MKKLIYSFLIFGLIMFAPAFVFAQDNDTTTVDDVAVVSEEADQDENITAEDLNIEEPTLLPDSPFYFAKDWWRGINTFFTFDPVKKAEKQLKHTDERLIEAKKVAEKTGDPELLARAMERHSRSVDKLARRIESFKDRLDDNPELQNVVDKFTEKQLLHQRVIDELEGRLEDAPLDIQERFAEARDKIAQRFAEALHEVDGDKLAERLDRAAQKIKGSEFKPLKNLEVLKRLEEKLPEQALPAIRRAQENALKRLKNNLEALDPAEREDKFGRYLEKIHGNETRHLEILEDLRLREDVSDDLLSSINMAKERPLIRIREKLKSLDTEEEREIYLRHLKDGTLEKLKLLKEIENNLDLEEAEKLKKLKEEAMDRFHQRIQDPEKREELLKKLMGADVRQFEVIEELEGRLPEDKQEFLKRLREKTFTNLKDRLDAIPDERKKELYLKKISGDDPNQLEVLRRVQEKLRDQLPESAKAADVLERVIRAQRERIEGRIEHIQDPERLELFKQRIEMHPETKREILERSPDLLRRIEARKEEVRLCAQVLTPARNVLTKECRIFRSSCLLEGWRADQTCKEEEKPILKDTIMEDKVMEDKVMESTMMKDELKTAESTALNRVWRIKITSDGFNPRALKIKRGNTVIWTNGTSRPSWPASAIHPTHSLYPQKGGCIGSSFDTCRGLKTNESFKFQFNEAGSWKYHDHLAPRLIGVVEVSR